MAATRDGPAGCPVHDYPFEQPTVVDAPPQWAQLREQCPVADVRLPSGDQALLLTRYEDVRATLTDPRTFVPGMPLAAYAGLKAKF